MIPNFQTTSNGNKEELSAEKICLQSEGAVEGKLEGRNFCPPSFSATEFRISLCKMRRQEKLVKSKENMYSNNRFKI